MLGPTGLEGVAGVGGGMGARSVAGIGSIGVPAALTVGGIATGLDPLSMGWGAFKGGRKMAGLAGGLAGVAGVAGGFYLGSQALDYATGQMTIGAARRGRMQSLLGKQFGFHGGQGRGMGNQEVGRMSDEVYKLAKDLDRDVSAVTRNLTMMRNLGLDRKVRDVEEYRRTFSKMTKAMDKIADVYGVTLQEAGKFLQGSKMAGFRSIADQMATLTPVRQAQWATGMNRSQVQGVMRGGTQLARAIGATGWRGAMGAQRSLVGFGAAEKAGIINEGMMEEATGVSGPGAYAAMTQVSQRAMARRLSSRFGRYFMAASATDDMRRLDPTRMQEVLGGMSMKDIRGRARKAVYGRGRKGMDRRFVMHEEEMRGQMLQQGITGLAGMVSAEFGEKIYNAEDPRVNKMVRKAYGLSKRQAEVVLRTARRLPDMMAEQFRQEEARLAHQASGRGGAYGFARLSKSVKKWLTNNVDVPLQRLGENIGQSIRTVTSSIERGIFGGGGGGRTATISRGAARIMTQQMAGTGYLDLAPTRGVKAPTPRTAADRLHLALRKGTSMAGWKPGGWGSESEAAEAMRGVGSAGREWFESGGARDVAREVGGLSFMAPQLAGEIGAMTARATGPEGVRRFLGDARGSAAAARYAMMGRQAGFGGKYDLMGLGGGITGGGTGGKKMTMKDWTRIAQDVYGEDVINQNVLNRAATHMGGRGGYLRLQGRAQQSRRQARGARLHPEAFGKEQREKLISREREDKKALEEYENRLRKVAVKERIGGAGMVPGLQALLKDQGTADIIMRAARGNEGALKAMRAISGSPGFAGGKELRALEKRLRDATPEQKKRIQAAVQEGVLRGGETRRRNITEARMGRLRFSTGQRDVLEQAGMLGTMDKLIHGGEKGKYYGTQARGVKLGEFFTKYWESGAEVRGKVGRMIRGRSGAEEFEPGLRVLDRLRKVVGTKKGWQERGLKKGKLRSALSIIMGGKTVTDEMMEAVKNKDLTPEQLSKKLGVEKGFAGMIQEDVRSGGKLTGKEAGSLATQTARMTAAASAVGVTKWEGIRDVLGETSMKGFGTSGGMHVEMKRQSSYLKVIAHHAGKGNPLLQQMLDKIEGKSTSTGKKGPTGGG